ncbi:hypothetical protein GCM10009555_007390 [Acrocarpospora macrocephala]|uniref:Uncharacterized protein n=1 Tax=Acrocarpospora macrocephala TaxID=150177 RepID=A0A5M3WU87_9ACTN|nr:hypothetical protein Amac_065420 [Acrocarpospora macrocephala]
MASITQTAWTSVAQSSPAKNCAGGSETGSETGKATPDGGSDDPAATGPAPGWSLTGALRRISLLPVPSPARTGGGGVMEALEERPHKAVTPAPAGFQQQAPYGCL